MSVHHTSLCKLLTRFQATAWLAYSLFLAASTAHLLVLDLRHDI